MKWYFIRSPADKNGWIVKAFDKDDAIFRAASSLLPILDNWSIDDLIVREVSSINSRSLIGQIMHFKDSECFYTLPEDITLKAEPRGY